jgi:ABC-type glycerol-3-phosphate transport system substrate-binding protein
VVTAVRGGLALALDDRVKQWGQTDDYFSAALNQPRWKESLWGLPAIAFANTYFWRRDLLQQEGVAQLPTTFEQSLDECRRLTRVENGEIVRQGVGFLELWAEFFMGLRGQGQPLARAGKSTFNGPEGLAMLQYQVDRAALTTPPGANPPPAQPPNPLGRGVWAGAWGHYANIVNDARVGTPDTYSSVAVGQPLVPGNQQYRAPAGRSWRPATFSFHDWWLVVKPGGAPDQSWELLKHMSSPELLFAFNEPIGTLPPRKSAQGKGYLAEAQLKDVADLYLRYGQPQYKYPIPQDLNPGINGPLSDALARKVAPKEALDAAARTWDAAMAQQDFHDDVT